MDIPVHHENELPDIARELVYHLKNDGYLMEHPGDFAKVVLPFLQRAYNCGWFDYRTSINKLPTYVGGENKNATPIKS